MVEKRNYYENGLYDSETGGIAARGEFSFNWKHPAQLFCWLMQLMKHPASTIRRVAADGNMTQPLVLVLMNVISVFLAGIICLVAMNVRYSFYFSWAHIPVAGIIIFAVLLALVFDFGFSGLLFVSTSIIFREKTTFLKMFSITGGKVIIDSLFILAGSVFMLAGNFFFFLFVIIGNIISFTVLVTIYNEEIKLQADKKIYSFSGSLAVISIVVMFMLKAVSSLITGNILNYISLF